MKVGVALKPATPAELLLPYLQQGLLDMVRGSAAEHLAAVQQPTNNSVFGVLTWWLNTTQLHTLWRCKSSWVWWQYREVEQPLHITGHSAECTQSINCCFACHLVQHAATGWQRAGVVSCAEHCSFGACMVLHSAIL
jgi:hypothetical protein